MLGDRELFYHNFLPFYNFTIFFSATMILKGFNFCISEAQSPNYDYFRGAGVKLFPNCDPVDLSILIISIIQLHIKPHKN